MRSGARIQPLAVDGQVKAALRSLAVLQAEAQLAAFSFLIWSAAFCTGSIRLPRVAALVAEDKLLQ